MKSRTAIFVCILIAINFNSAGQERKKQSVFKQLFGVSVNETSDKFEGTTTYQMKGNKVFSELSGSNALGNLIFGGDAVTFNTFMNLEKHVLKDGSYELAILFKVEANNDLFVRVMEGESLIFLLDDGRLDLTTDGSYNTDYDMMNQSSVANARYRITKKQVQQINSSSKVEFRVILDSFQLGAAEDRDKNNQHLDGKFTKKNRKVWIEFYDDYLVL
ncbi:hypothetical protein [Maribacter sp. R77961]|uniref:hypothetical protein n=1 Tax=Maribacter sp. R77961 TaxID=3093871 RepID=UPI0037CC1F11